MTPTTFHGERVTLRPHGDDDAEALATILAEPEVTRWWPAFDASEVRAEILTEPGWVITVDGHVAGWLEYGEEDEPDYRHVGLDIFLATRFQGRGLGPEALRLAIAHFVAAGHHRFTIDPAAANERAIRGYASLGFKPVGIMRAYERDRDGRGWHDGLLMDLLAGELTSG